MVSLPSYLARYCLHPCIKGAKTEALGGYPAQDHNERSRWSPGPTLTPQLCMQFSRYPSYTCLLQPHTPTSPQKRLVQISTSFSARGTKSWTSSNLQPLSQAPERRQGRAPLLHLLLSFPDNKEGFSLWCRRREKGGERDPYSALPAAI